MISLHCVSKTGLMVLFSVYLCPLHVSRTRANSVVQCHVHAAQQWEDTMSGRGKQQLVTMLTIVALITYPRH